MLPIKKIDVILDQYIKYTHQLYQFVKKELERWGGGLIIGIEVEKLQGDKI